MNVGATCVGGWKLEGKEIAFREATKADAAVLALIGAATFLESFAGLLSGAALVAGALEKHTPASYGSLLAKPGTRAWIAEVPSEPDSSGAPVGYLILSAPDFPADLLEEGDRELKRIYLFSRFHRTGAGQRMMDLAIATAKADGNKRLLLGVHQDNVRALAFYHRNGFREIGRRQFTLGSSTYDDPVLALTL